MGVNYRGQLLPSSRQASSNASEGGGNRESSLDDSGVVDDHEDQDHEMTPSQSPIFPPNYLAEQKKLGKKSGTGKKVGAEVGATITTATTTTTTTMNPRDVQVVKCNGNIVQLSKDNMCAFQPEYLSQIVILGKLDTMKCEMSNKLALNMSAFLFHSICARSVDDVPDRNCAKCVQCCIDYEGWLQFQNCLYKV